MGLSNEPQKSADLYLLIQQMVGYMADIASDPNALKKAIANNYGLSEEEKKRSEKARADIETNRDILNSIRQETEANNKQKSEIAASFSELEEKNNALNVRSTELNKFSRQLDDASAQLSVREKNVSLRESQVSDQQIKLDKKESELLLRQKELDEFDADLKARANRLRDIASGG